jgi:NAD(P)-dependent dehydrogenase (short-subunit alcohol dehydrogenase family)
MTDGFAGKTFAITGGSKGLGLTCTRQLLERGARVVVLSRSRGELDHLAPELRENLHWVQMDLANPGATADIFATIRELVGGLDGLVLNAALTEPKSFAELTEADVNASLTANIAGPLLCLQQGAALMKGGRVIFVSSESVEHPFPMLSLYAVVKAAMEMLFKAVRRELYVDHQVQLTVLRSGSMAGTSFGDSWSQDTRSKFYEVAASTGNIQETGTPMPPERVAAGVLFVLGLPADATVNFLDVRSGDAY